MISKHTLSTTASNQKYSEENYQTVTRRKWLHFSLNQLIDAEILLMKIHLLVNFNVWKSGLDIPVSRRVSISITQKKTVILVSHWIIRCVSFYVPH